MPLFALILLLATARAETTWYVLPRVAYDTDDGVGGGFMAETARLGRDPFRWSLSLGSFITSRGYQHHQLRWDRPGPEAARVRWTVDAAWRQWTHDGYWGMGGDTMRETAFVGDFEADDPRRDRYRYRLDQPYAYARARVAIGGPWSLMAGINPKYSRIAFYEGSLLASERPYGVEGGLVLPVAAGVLFDTREPEIAPMNGVLLELTARAAPLGTGEAAGWWGVFASASGFSGGERAVLAGRVMGEWLGALPAGTPESGVPFYEMVHWGGYVPVQGFGGSQTLRGLAFGRWRGPGKAVANAELRLNIGEHGLFGRSLRWELAPFADAGLVFGTGDLTPHASAGLGLRPILDDTFVGRVDLGLGSDPDEDGPALSWGLYITFGHAF